MCIVRIQKHISSSSCSFFPEEGEIFLIMIGEHTHTRTHTHTPSPPPKEYRVDPAGFFPGHSLVILSQRWLRHVCLYEPFLTFSVLFKAYKDHRLLKCWILVLLSLSPKLLCFVTFTSLLISWPTLCVSVVNSAGLWENWASLHIV